jgi:hypothetical protein
VSRASRPASGPRFHRNSATTRGRQETRNYYNTVQDAVIVDRLKPGRGYMHLLRKSDVLEFIELLPEWPTLAEGLDAIVLSTGNDEQYGWHMPGVVHICAWDRRLWETGTWESIEENLEVFELLGVELEKEGSRWVVKWTREQARAFQLVEVLLHELGHHYDRITTRSQYDPGRGERFADEFASAMRRELLEDRGLAAKILF